MPRNTPFVFVALLALSLLWSVPALAQEEDGTWTGEVVDLACYVGTGAVGAANVQCRADRAQAINARRVRDSQPMGLLTDDGTLVLLVPAKDGGAAFRALREQVGTTAQISGSLAERDGMKVVQVMEVKPAP